MVSLRLAVFLAVVGGGSCFLSPTAVRASGPSRRTQVRASAPSNTNAGLSRRRLLAVPLGGVFMSWATAANADAVGVGVRITAKKRYDARVEKGSLAFLSLEKAVASADFTAISEFAAGDSFADFKSAGPLLATSFRTSSGQRLDKIPQNVKFNAFVSDVTDMQAAAKKKNADALQTSFGAAKEHLAAYRASVADVY